MQTKPALSLAAVAGRRHALIDLAVRLEEEGFDGVFSPSMGDAMGLIGAVALKTNRIRLGTGIANIYMRHCGAQEFDPYLWSVPIGFLDPTVRLARTPSVLIQSDSDEVLGPHTWCRRRQ